MNTTTRAKGSWSRLNRRLLVFVWAAALLGAVDAKAEPAKTLVQDTLYRADGSVAHGKVLIRWSGFSTSAGEAVPAGEISLVTDANGGISIPLIPNTGSVPAGGYYRVVIKLDDGTTSEEQWVVPATAITKVAAVRANVVTQAVAAQFASRDYVDSALGKLAVGAVVHLSGAESIQGTKTFLNSPEVPVPADARGAANKGYVDQKVSGLAGVNFDAPGAIGSTTPGAVNATAYSVNGSPLSSQNLNDSATLLKTSEANSFTAPQKMPDVITSKTPLVDVRAFGAVCNALSTGVNPGTWSDDHAAIQAAMEYAFTNGGEVYFPPKTCYTSIPIVYKGQNMGGNGKSLSFVRGGAGKDVFVALDPLDGGVGLRQTVHIHGMAMVVDDSVDATIAPGYANQKRWAGSNTLYSNQKWTNTLLAAMGAADTVFSVVSAPPTDFNPVNLNHKAQNGCVQIDAEVMCYQDMAPNLSAFGGELDTITNVVSTPQTATFTANNAFVAGQWAQVYGLTHSWRGTYQVSAATPTSFTVVNASPNAMATYSGPDSATALTGQLLRGQFGTLAAVHSPGATVTAVNPFTGGLNVLEDIPAWQIGACAMAFPNRVGTTNVGYGMLHSVIEGVAFVSVGLITPTNMTNCGYYTQRAPYHIAYKDDEFSGKFGWISDFSSNNQDSQITGQATMDTASFTNLRINAIVPFVASSGGDVSMEQISVYSDSWNVLPMQFPLGLVIKNGYTLNKAVKFTPAGWTIKTLYVEPSYQYMSNGAPPYVVSEIDGDAITFLSGAPIQAYNAGVTVFNGDHNRVYGSFYGGGHNNIVSAIINGNSGLYDFSSSMRPGDVIDNGVGNVTTGSTGQYGYRSANLVPTRSGLFNQVAPDALLQGNVNGDWYQSLADLFILPEDLVRAIGGLQPAMVFNDKTVPITGKYLQIAAPGSLSLSTVDEGALNFSTGGLASRMPVGKGICYVILKAGAPTTQTWNFGSNGGSYIGYGSATFTLTTSWAIYSMPYNTSNALAAGNTLLTGGSAATSAATSVSFGGMMFVPQTDYLQAGTVNATSYQSGGAPITTGALADWSNIGRTTGFVPTWNGTQWAPAASAGGATNTGGLTDWTNTGLSTGYVPAWNGTKWAPAPPVAGVGAVVGATAPTTYTGSGVAANNVTLYTPVTAGMFRGCATLTTTAVGTAGSYYLVMIYTGDGHAFSPNITNNVSVTTQWSTAGVCYDFYADAGLPIRYSIPNAVVTGTPTIRYAVTLERLQ